jgi:transcriptional regulator with XRE-family HTH domain
MSSFTKPGQWQKHVSTIVKQMRAERGWSQEQLDGEADLPIGTIARVEAQQISPTRKTVTKICNAFGVHVSLIDPQAKEESK